MDQRIIDKGYGFAIFPTVKIIKPVAASNGTAELKSAKHTVFGDITNQNMAYNNLRIESLAVILHMNRNGNLKFPQHA